MKNEIYNAEEREEQLNKMSDASARFYAQAVAIGVHPFIEFTGLMNEYIKICREIHANGEDFNCFNAHTGKKLPVPKHSLEYIAEKLNCIFLEQIVVKP